MVALLVLLWLSLVAASAAEPIPFDGTPVSETVQDTNGAVWAVCYSCEGQLLKWEGERWNSMRLKAPLDQARPLTLAIDPSGVLWSLWAERRKPSPELDCWLVRHGTNGQFASFPFRGAHAASELFFDSKGRGWITQASPDIFQFNSEGEIKKAYWLAPSEIGNPDVLHTPFNRVHALEDSIGRIWFWAGHETVSKDTFKGVLIFDGQTFTYHPTLPGIRDVSFSFFGKKDEHSVWITHYVGPKAGPFELNMETMAVTEVRQPSLFALSPVAHLFHAGGDLYADCQNTLWRQHGDKWQVALTNMNRRLPENQSRFERFEVRADRAWLLTREGLWIGSSGNGLWLLSSNGVRKIDQSAGLPTPSVDRLHQLPDGRILCVDLKHATAMLPVERALGIAALSASNENSSNTPPSRCQSITASYPLVRDSQGHLWSILVGEALNEWTGESWRKHPLPEALLKPGTQAYGLAIDSLGRLWDLLSEGAGILEPSSDRWTVYSSYHDAFKAMAELNPIPRLDLPRLQSPCFGAKGRIAYFDSAYTLHYFDGGQWQKWALQTVIGEGSLAPTGLPSFDRDGLLSVEFPYFTRTLSATGWEETPNSRRAVPRSLPQVAPQPPLPAEAITRNPDWYIADEFGLGWLGWHQQLYRVGLGQCLPEFSPNESHPFIEPGKYDGALSDCRGNIFFHSPDSRFQQHYVMMKPPAAPPEARIQYREISPDQVEFQLSSPNSKSPWFALRLNGSAWSSPEKKSHFELGPLARGEYKIEAVAIDDRLQISPQPTSLAFKITVDPEVQILKSISQLSTKDRSQREFVIRTLVNQSEIALPLLKKARLNASEDQQWWIDVAIQEINRASHGTQ